MEIVSETGSLEEAGSSKVENGLGSNKFDIFKRSNSGHEIFGGKEGFSVEVFVGTQFGDAVQGSHFGQSVQVFESFGVAQLLPLASPHVSGQFFFQRSEADKTSNLSDGLLVEELLVVVGVRSNEVSCELSGGHVAGAAHDGFGGAESFPLASVDLVGNLGSQSLFEVLFVLNSGKVLDVAVGGDGVDGRDASGFGAKVDDVFEGDCESGGGSESQGGEEFHC